MVQVIEHLPSKCKALSSNPVLQKKEREGRKEVGERERRKKEKEKQCN
jgi:hypothetical protein